MLVFQWWKTTEARADATGAFTAASLADHPEIIRILYDAWMTLPLCSLLPSTSGFVLWVLGTKKYLLTGYHYRVR